MMKSVCALRHKPGSDRAAFQRYYEANHAPLGVQHFPFTRYVRNHLIDGEDLGVDTISEFWAEDIVATAALMDGPVGDILRADEERFMDRPAIAAAGADEHVLSAGAPGAERFVTLIAGGAGDPASFGAAVLEWAHGIAAETPAVSLDLVTPWGAPAFPAAALLWSNAPPADAPASLQPARTLRVHRVETPADTLLGNRPR